jgi:hypothetical protein
MMLVLLAFEACFAQIKLMLDFAQEIVSYAAPIAKLDGRLSLDSKQFLG